VTPDEIRARVSALMRTFQNAGAGPAGWKALAVWTLEREGAAWQPIETAPMDGTEVDLWANGRRTDCHIHCGEWLKWMSTSVDDEPRWLPIEQPTHWMPLPEPPK
jgi:hypothetical protein